MVVAVAAVLMATLSPSAGGCGTQTPEEFSKNFLGSREGKQGAHGPGLQDRGTWRLHVQSQQQWLRRLRVQRPRERITHRDVQHGWHGS